MKPLKLTMQAFGSYANETTISFENMDQNFFLIAGDTGAGKTTIFDAISYALYGEVASSVNKKSGVLLQSDYASVDVEPFVELIFSERRMEEYCNSQGKTRPGVLFRGGSKRAWHSPVP